MKNINWDNVEAAGNYTKIPAGGYVCGIVNVEDMPEKEYLKFDFDIAAGEYKNHFSERYSGKDFWGANFIKSYKEKALPFFKAMLEAFKESNSGFVVNSSDEQRMKRKFIGLVLGYEEYIGNDGKVKERMYVDQILPVSKIQSGEFTVPELKRLNGASDVPPVNDDIPPVEDDDLPWN